MEAFLFSLYYCFHSSNSLSFNKNELTTIKFYKWKKFILSFAILFSLLGKYPDACVGFTDRAAGLLIPRPLAAGSFILEGDNEKYLKILPNLKENAIFPTIPPSELQDFLSQRREEPSSRNSEPLAQESIQSSEPSTARFHLSVSEAVLLSGSASNNMIGAFNSPPICA